MDLGVYPLSTCVCLCVCAYMCVCIHMYVCLCVCLITRSLFTDVTSTLYSVMIFFFVSWNKFTIIGLMSWRKHLRQKKLCESDCVVNRYAITTHTHTHIYYIYRLIFTVVIMLAVYNLNYLRSSDAIYLW